jgi:hypothetical protein
MRNLLVYPIVHGEAISAIQDAQQEYYKKYSEHIGEPGGLALLFVEEFIRENKDAFDAYSAKHITPAPKV